jgi:ribosomal protein L29
MRPSQPCVHVPTLLEFSTLIQNFDSVIPIMAATKRKSVGDTEPEVAPKRARSSLPVSPETTLTEEELNDMSKEELVQHALDLQARLQLPVASIPEPKEMSAEQLAAKVQKAKQMLIRGIEKQMKVRTKQYSAMIRSKCFTVDAFLQDGQSAIYIRGLLSRRTRLQGDAGTAGLPQE